MISKKIIKIFLMVFSIVFLYGCPAFAEKIAIIVNKNNNDTIRPVTIKRIFLKEYRIWSSGEEVIPLDLTEGGLKAKFSKAVLGKDVDSLRLYWIQKRLRQVLRPPFQIPTISKVKKYINKIPNAISYIPAKDVDDTIKVVLEIDG